LQKHHNLSKDEVEPLSYRRRDLSPLKKYAKKKTMRQVELKNMGFDPESESEQEEEEAK